MDHKTIWCKLENGYHVLVRSRPSHAADRLVMEYNENVEAGREYVALEYGYNPNQTNNSLISV